MNFIPNSSIKDLMLKEMGINDIEELFLDIPKKIAVKKLDIDTGLSQQDTEQKLRSIANKNKSFYDMTSFLGGGVIPEEDIPALKKAGIAGIFGPGTPTDNIAKFIRKNVKR